MNRRHRKVLAALVLATQVGSAHAERVIDAVPDTLPGKGFGALTGFMAGFAGGPVGALAGAGIGWLAGYAAQATTGLHATAYRVQDDAGAVRVVRSPKRTWSPGDRVRVDGNRLVAEQDDGGQPLAVTAAR